MLLMKKKHRDYKSLLQGAQILLTLAVAIGVLFSITPAADGFIATDHHLKPHLKRKLNNLIRRVHKDQWVIGYWYADNCRPRARNNGEAIEEAITQALNAWLQPVRDLNTGKPVVNDFRYVPNLVIKNDADLLFYDLLIEFYCNFDKSHALVGPEEHKPPLLIIHQGTDVNPKFSFALLHEIGHSFGLGDTYPRLELEMEELRVSRGGLWGTIGHQPASIMCGLIRLIAPRSISQDDANGIVWLYKFYHENLPLEDCIFPDYELETSPDGCCPKSPLIFEIKHNNSESFALRVINEDRNTDVNATDEDGLTALHYAVEKEYPRLLERLLSHKDIDVNVRNAEGSTALFWAAKRKSYGIIERLLEQKQRESDWTAVNKPAPAYHRSVFYLLHDPNMIFHAGYLGTVLGEGALFVAQKREGDSIEKFLSKGDFTLVSHSGVVAESIKIREIASFPGADGETGSVLLAIRDVDLSAYEPLLVSTDPILTETDVELLTYKFGSGIALKGNDKDNALNLPLQVRACVSVPHVGLGAKGLWQHTCGPANSVSDGSILFHEKTGTILGFYRSQESDEILGDGLPLADVVSEALMGLVDRKPVTPKERLTTTWAEIKMKQ